MFDWLSAKLSSVFASIAGERSLSVQRTRDALTRVREALLAADVPQVVVQHFIAQVTTLVDERFAQKKVQSGEQIIALVYEQLVALLTAGQDTFDTLQAPAIVLVCGLQGSGKTTSIAKVGHYVAQHRTWRVACGSIDFARPAALQQLQIVAGQAAMTYLATSSTEPVSAARELVAQCKQSNYDLLLLDTAGRLHVDDALLAQLHAVRLSVQPTYTLLVLDVMTGQESLSVVQAFEQVVGFDGVMLTKTDSGARGGAALACAQVLKKPIVLVGTGEKISDIERWYPDRAAKRLLGMGDIESLLQRAERVLDRQQQEMSSQRLMSGEFTLEDFAQQLGMMHKLGSLQSIMRLLPGGMTIGREQAEQGEQELQRFKVMLDSMTPKERRMPHIINKSRIIRIARGAGVTPVQVRALLDKFEQSKQFVKLLSKSGSFRNFISR